MEKIYSVSEINKYIKNRLESDNELCNLQVTGEISNFKRQQNSGHCYFSLKDKGGVLNCVMFRYKAMSLRFEPRNGDTVVAIGHISVYEAGGNYQLYVDMLIPKGQGDLMLEYERLKQKLLAEGLFAEEKKQALPDNPKTIGIVTSPTGAAVRDIISVSRRRNPGIKIYLFPVKVQGKGSAQEVARAIRFFNRTKLAEVLIVGRGGGSIEDLWAFNEEVTVRAVAASKIPIVSAVGHETDFTLCDFAADKRAATPSQAAEMAVADVDKLYQRVKYLDRRLQLLFNNELEQLEYRLDRCKSSAVLNQPQRLYKALEERVARATTARVFREPELLFANKEQRLDFAVNALQKQLQEKVTNDDHRLGLLAAKLAGLNPLSVLSRGYSMSKVNDKVLTSVEQVGWGEEIVTSLADGTVYSVVQEVVKNNGSKENC